MGIHFVSAPRPCETTLQGVPSSQLQKQSAVTGATIRVHVWFLDRSEESRRTKPPDDIRLVSSLEFPVLF